MNDASTRHVSLECHVALPHDEVWRLLANTEHLNRAIGLSAVRYEPVPEESQAVYRDAETHMAGQRVRFREYPFQWVQGEALSVRRVYENGPIRETHFSVQTHEAADKATRLELSLDLLPANSAIGAILPAIAQRSLRRIAAYCQMYCRMRAQEENLPVTAELPQNEDLEIENSRRAALAPSSVYLPAPTAASVVNARALENALHSLQSLLKEETGLPEAQGIQVEIFRCLISLIRNGGDDEVASLRPYHLARAWGFPRDETLRVFLLSTKAGLLHLSWNLMCPNCRVSKVETDSLSGVTPQFHCDLCGVEYSADFDRSVELRFKIHPAIRAVDEKVYCLSGPYASPHVILQQSLPRGETMSLRAPEIAEPLRLRVLRWNHSLAFLDDSENAEQQQTLQRVEYESSGWPAESVTATDCELEIVNRSDTDIVFVLEKTAPDADAVTAHYVTTMPEFRRSFGSQVLAPGAHVGIENVALFFSDLKDSTAMYERHGDAPAYGNVREHFLFLTQYIESNGGSVVKTIGDAVMAVFPTPENALRASLQMQKLLPEFNSTRAQQPVTLKIGLHCGPAIAVNSNERLDYFGRTVNIAARISNTGHGGDIVLSHHMMEYPGAPELLREQGARVEKFEANLKGIDGIFTLYRTCP